MITSVDNTILKPRPDCDPRYVVYVLSSPEYLDWVQVLCRVGGGFRFRVSRSMLGDIQVPAPPLSEQQRIAEFLDRRTAPIDTLIAKKERLIELLQEKRQALITRAVTKGLDPSVSMKASGVEWLGQVPTTSRIIPLRWLCDRLQAGTTPPTAEPRYFEDGSVPWYGPSSFDAGLDLGEPAKFLNESAVREGCARLFAAGFTLIITIGATIGKVAFLEAPGSTNQQITAVVARERDVVPRFLAYYMKAFEGVLRALAPVTTLPILNQSQLGTFPVVVPPLEAQRTVVAYLQAFETRSVALLKGLQTSIVCLREYRQALITAAVTGKIDVSNEAA